MILARYEEDYQRNQPGLVEEAMSLLAAARRGLSQAELLELLGSQGVPLPGAVWSPLYLAAEQALMDRAGLLSFGHDYFRQAVRDRYLAAEEKVRNVHLRLADYFDRQDLEIGDRPNLRKIDELPWHWPRPGPGPGFRGCWWNQVFSDKPGRMTSLRSRPTGRRLRLIPPCAWPRPIGGC